MHKPETASLFDICPPGPGICWWPIDRVGDFLILYLPFIIKDWRAETKNRLTCTFYF
jgi:hypothetical protein